MARKFSTRRVSALSDLPAADAEHLRKPDVEALRPPFSSHRPRILILYGWLRLVSYSRLLAHEARRLLEHFGAEARVFDPEGLPLPNGAPANSSTYAFMVRLSLSLTRHGSRVKTR